MKKISIILGMAFMMALTACTEAKIEKVDKPASNSPTAAPAAPEASPSASSSAEAASAASAAASNNAPEVFAMGDTVKFDDLEITLNGARVDQGNDFLKPEKGKYVIVDLTIENKGTESAAISTIMQMKLNDAEAYSYNIALYTELKGSLDGEVGAGRKVRGEVAFDVPDSAYYEFMFEDVFSSGQAIWKFEAK